MSRTLLLTGFEPFGAHALNPSLLAAKALDGRTIGGFDVRGAGLPVSWKLSGPALLEALDAHGPSVAILTGLQPSRWFSVERAAHNLDDSMEPDNDGIVKIESPISKEGPAAYWATLPVSRIARAMNSVGLKTTVSGSAGFYLCNHAFYLLMDRLALTGGIGGFIHVPPTTQLDPSSPFTQAEIVRGIEVAICALAAG